MTRIRGKKTSPELVTGMVEMFRKLTIFYSWAGGSKDDNFKLSIDDIALFSGKVTGGSITHRLEDASKPSGSLINSLSTVSSHVKIITDTDLTHAKSSVNYTICYQAIVLSPILMEHG